MLYKSRKVEELDSIYDIKVDMHRAYPKWVKDTCLSIQRIFNKNGIHLTLFEVKELCETYSEEVYNSTWSFEFDNLSDKEIFDKLIDYLQLSLSDKGKRVLWSSREVNLYRYSNESKINKETKTYT